MSHPVGERLRCDECGAEIVYVEACDCPADDAKRHENVCCNQVMRSLGVQRPAEPGEPAPADAGP